MDRQRLLSLALVALLALAWGAIQPGPARADNPGITPYGAITSGHCASWHGGRYQIADAGQACGSGTVAAGTSGQIATYPASGTLVQGANIASFLSAGTGITLSGTTAATITLANPSATTIGGVESYAGVSHEWLYGISTAGVPLSSRPACADLSDSAASCATDATDAANISSGTLAAARGGASYPASGDVVISGGAGVAPSGVAPSGTDCLVSSGGAWVAGACSSGLSGVSSFNTRTGAVTLSGTDVSGAGGLLASNNLSDVGSASTALANIGGNDAGNLSTGTLPAGRLPALTGDTTTTAGSTATTTAHVNGVSYGTAPATNTVPVVTAANTTTYETVPNAALAHSSLTVAGHAISLGGSQTIACADLSDAGTACTAAAPAGAIVGTSDVQTLTNKSIAATEVNSGTLAAAQMPALTGDVTSSVGSTATTLAASGVTAGSYTAASITVNSKGLVTSASNGTTGVTFTDGTTTVSGATQLTVSGGTIGGTAPNATLTISGGGGGGTACPQSGLASGQYYTMPNLTATPSAGSAVTANVLYAMPVFLCSQQTVATIGMQVSTVSGSVTCDVVDYAPGSGMPGALNTNYGQVTFSGAGFASLAPGSYVIPAGVSWLAFGCNGTPTFFAGQSNFTTDISGLAAVNGSFQVRTISNTTYTVGSPPSSWPGSTFNAVNTPLIYFHS